MISSFIVGILTEIWTGDHWDEIFALINVIFGGAPSA